MSAAQCSKTYLSEHDYLEGEKLAKERHEYHDGVAYAMAGTTRRHNRIAMNIVVAARLATREKPCEVLSSDVKVRATKHKAFYYPDVVIGCAPDETNPYYLEKPCLIVEVTSKSTEWKDRHEKVMAYQTLASLQTYLVVAQDRVHVTVFYREKDDNAWWVTAYETLEQVIPLVCPDMQLTVADIYEGVDFNLPDE